MAHTNHSSCPKMLLSMNKIQIFPPSRSIRLFHFYECERFRPHRTVEDEQAAAQKRLLTSACFSGMEFHWYWFSLHTHERYRAGASASQRGKKVYGSQQTMERSNFYGIMVIFHEIFMVLISLFCAISLHTPTAASARAHLIHTVSNWALLCALVFWNLYLYILFFYSPLNFNAVCERESEGAKSDSTSLNYAQCYLWSTKIQFKFSIHRFSTSSGRHDRRRRRHEPAIHRRRLTTTKIRKRARVNVDDIHAIPKNHN